MRLTILPLLLTLAASCTGHPSSKSQDERQEEPVSADTGLTATKIDDVWIFVGPAKSFPNPENLKIITTDDRQAGPATIENNCLLVDGEVIVWWREQTDLAKQIVGGAKTGRPLDVTIPGGEGRGISETPPLVSDRCGAKRVRHAGRGG